MWFWIGLVVVAILIYLFLYTPWEKKEDKAVVGPFDLSQSKEIGDTKASQTIIARSNSGSLQAFVYPLAFQRTGKLSMCSDGSTPRPGEPDCNSGRFGICACQGTDCTQCKHIGYVNILNISNVIRIEMLTAPDASRQNAALVQLVVRTLRNNPTKNDTEVVEETLVLPEIPLQKWTMVTIARDGRRFDVYYNNKLVSSKRTEHMIDTNSAVGPILAGDPNLSGSVAYAEVFDRRLTQAEVAATYSRLADTNGQPYLSKSKFDINDFLSICKDGNCLKGPSVRPSSPLLDWDTMYQ